MTVEQRILSAATELRASGSGDSLVLTGYAAKFNVLSHDLGNYREQIAPGAFRESIANGDDVVCTFNHDSNSVLGRTKSGTLKVAEDSTGLAFRCQLDPNQQSHRSIHAAVKRGDVSDCSFAFQCPEGGCDFNQRGTLEDGKTPCNIRTLRKVKLLDCSVVVRPAYPSTSVDARKAVVRFDDQTAIKAQIAAWEQRRKQRFTDARAIAAKYPGVALEDIAIRSRIYSGDQLEDVLLQLRSAAIGKTIRQGYTGADFDQCSADGGQAADPEQTFRDKDDVIHPELARTKAEHEESCCYHRNRASKAPSMQRCSAHHRCADAHRIAAETGDAGASAAARAASKELL
jgi:uncharacterized protein